MTLRQNDPATRILDVRGKLVVDYRAREWCTLPYPNHPHGCPNYQKHQSCPPQAPRIDKWLDLSRPHWLIVAGFDLAAFARRMKRLHPKWSDRQCRCLLYWQPSVRARLLSTCREFQSAHPGSVFTLIPEAMGVHVIKTVRALHVPIEIRPRRTVFKVGLLGYPNQVLDDKRRVDGGENDQ